MRPLLAAHLVDLATFVLAVGIAGVSIEAELNPTMVVAYTLAGLAGVAIWKSVLLGLLVVLVRRVRTRSRRAARLLAYSIGLVGAASNVVALLRVANG